MTSNDILTKYRAYLISLVHSERGGSDCSTPFLFEILDEIPFESLVLGDENRVADALYMRHLWESDRNYHISASDKPVSLLEIMVILSQDLSFMCTGLVENSSVERWFDEMINNLQLNFSQNDDENRRILERVVARQYGSDGVGGLFPLLNPGQDQRKIELWGQANEYVIERYL